WSPPPPWSSPNAVPGWAVTPDRGARCSLPGRTRAAGDDAPGALDRGRGGPRTVVASGGGWCSRAQGGWARSVENGSPRAASPRWGGTKAVPDTSRAPSRSGSLVARWSRQARLGSDHGRDRVTGAGGGAAGAIQPGPAAARTGGGRPRGRQWSGAAPGFPALFMVVVGAGGGGDARGGRTPAPAAHRRGAGRRHRAGVLSAAAELVEP